MNDSEYYSFEDRLYENPTTSRDEQMSFIDNLRAAEQVANAQIKTQTENLGTQIPSVKGGLTGPESYFQSRYQTPVTNARVADLKAAAQADALNKVLSNYSSQMQKRYNDAYKQYQKNQAKQAASSGGSTGGTSGSSTDGEIETIASDTPLTATSTISSAPLGASKYANIENGGDEWVDTSYTDMDGRVHRVYTDNIGHRVEYIGDDKVYDNTIEGIVSELQKQLISGSGWKANEQQAREYLDAHPNITAYDVTQPKNLLIADNGGGAW